MKCLERKDQVIIFRLRTMHIQLNANLSRITKDHPTACTLYGYKEETVQHFLFDCPFLQDTRKEFLPENPNLENILYCDKQQLLRTSKFFRKANRQRTQVQAWLDRKSKVSMKCLVYQYRDFHKFFGTSGRSARVAHSTTQKPQAQDDHLWEILQQKCR